MRKKIKEGNEVEKEIIKQRVNRLIQKGWRTEVVIGWTIAVIALFILYWVLKVLFPAPVKFLSFFIVFLVFAILFISSFYQIPPGHKGRIIRLGRRIGKLTEEEWSLLEGEEELKRLNEVFTLDEGPKILAPLIDKLIVVDCRRKLSSFRTQDLETKDKLRLWLIFDVRWRIADPFKFIELEQGLDFIEEGIRNLINDFCISYFRRFKLEEIIAPPEAVEECEERLFDFKKFEKTLIKSLSAQEVKEEKEELQRLYPGGPLIYRLQQGPLKEWGVELFGITIRDVDFPTETRKRLEDIRHSHYEKQAKIIDAEAERKVMVIKARGEARRRILVEGAIAEITQKLAQELGITPQQSIQYFALKRFVEEWAEAIKGGKATVILPLELAGMGGIIAAIEKVLGGIVQTRGEE